MTNAKSLAVMRPNRHFVGTYFEHCLTLFIGATQMSQSTGISPSSINHILYGRPVRFRKTRKRYEAQCFAYLHGQEPEPPTPHIETTPTQQALDLDPQAVFVVSLPPAKADKLKAVMAMFGAEIVEVD
jgi:hypothetical protein